MAVVIRIVSWCAVFLSIAYFYISQAPWLNSGEFFAEAGRDFFRQVEYYKWWDFSFWLLPDAGYLSIPQRLIVSIIHILPLPRAYTPFYYTYFTFFSVVGYKLAFLHKDFSCVLSKFWQRAAIVSVAMIIFSSDTTKLISFPYLTIPYIFYFTFYLLNRNQQSDRFWLWFALLILMLLNKPINIVLAAPILGYFIVFRSWKESIIMIVAIMSQAVRILYSINNDIYRSVDEGLGLAHRLGLFFDKFFDTGHLVLAVIIITAFALLKKKSIFIVYVGFLVFWLLANNFYYAVLLNDAQLPLWFELAPLKPQRWNMGLLFLIVPLLICSFKMLEINGWVSKIVATLASIVVVIPWFQATQQFGSLRQKIEPTPISFSESHKLYSKYEAGCSYLSRPPVWKYQSLNNRCYFKGAPQNLTGAIIPNGNKISLYWNRDIKCDVIGLGVFVNQINPDARLKGRVNINLKDGTSIQRDIDLRVPGKPDGKKFVPVLIALDQKFETKTVESAEFYNTNLEGQARLVMAESGIDPTHAALDFICLRNSIYWK